MTTPQPIPKEQFLAVIEKTALVSIDLICLNDAGEVLLGLRNNRPAQGSWFVPGGRIFKDERVADGLRRIAAKELGLQALNPRLALPLGVFQHLYADNFAGVPDVSTHYIVLAYEILIGDASSLAIDPQHSELRWFPVPELLACEQVHPYTKAYFDASIDLTRVP